MSFRISIRNPNAPEEHSEVTEVTLHFDHEGLRAFAKFVRETLNDFEGPKRLDHYHLRDSLFTPEYHQQQRDNVSKDILIVPY